MPSKRERQQHLLEVIRRNQVSSQEELLELLLAEGLATTQSTLSRDLREIGVVKAPDGYRLLGSGLARPHVLRDLARAIRPQLHRWDAGGNILVLWPHQESQVRPLSEQIASAGAPEVVASLAADGRVLVVTRTPAQARRMARDLK